MTDERKAITSFPLAMRNFFGDRPDHTGSMEFMKEMKELTDSDKAEFREMLKEQGYGL